MEIRFEACIHFSNVSLSNKPEGNNLRHYIAVVHGLAFHAGAKFARHTIVFELSIPG